MKASRRRQELGPKVSAALPRVWSLMSRNGWSHADLARHAGTRSAAISRVLYADRLPGRTLAMALAKLGVRMSLWDEPCPDGWSPWASPNDATPTQPAQVNATVQP